MNGESLQLPIRDYCEAMPTFDHFLILDFEATCDDQAPVEPQEIIEFPGVVLDASGDSVAEFESFVRPVENPRLRPFCTELTSITQDQTDSAPVFVDVLANYERFLATHGLDHRNTLVVTCGDWDLRTMLPKQCRTAGVQTIPVIFTRWLNIKTLYRNVMNLQEGTRVSMPTMLGGLELTLLGHHHRGIDDCRNIGRVLRALIQKGGVPSITGRLSAKRYPPVDITLRTEEQRITVRLETRRLHTLRELARATFRRSPKALHFDSQRIERDDVLTQLMPGSEIEVRF